MAKRPKQKTAKGLEIPIPTKEASSTPIWLRSLRQQVVNALAGKTGLRSDPGDRDSGLAGSFAVAP